MVNALDEDPIKEHISDELANDIIATPKSILIKDYLADYKMSKNNAYFLKTIPIQCSKYQCEIGIRQTIDNPRNFSVYLLYNGTDIILRYNGYHGSHTNRIEGTKIYGPHIHRIT